ncbi:MAG TPA: hypothetical protein VGN54_15085 [Mycobacteriales bacterium]|nr:hypothetical protein [Mycobacteriales bacterium]
MAARIVDLMVLVVAIAGLILVGITIRLVARKRPPQPAPSRRDRLRPTARSMRGWQARTLREVRRGARSGRRR